MTPAELPADMAQLNLAMIPLQPRGNRAKHRWAVYLVGPVKGRDGYTSNGPTPLWGDTSNINDDKAKHDAAKTWPGLVYFPRPADTRRDQFPAFHFVLPFGPGEWGMGQQLERFAWMLAKRSGRHTSACRF